MKNIELSEEMGWWISEEIKGSIGEILGMGPGRRILSGGDIVGED